MTKLGLSAVCLFGVYCDAWIFLGAPSFGELTGGQFIGLCLLVLAGSSVYSSAKTGTYLLEHS